MLHPQLQRPELGDGRVDPNRHGLAGGKIGQSRQLHFQAARLLEFRFGVGGYTACLVKLCVYGPIAWCLMALDEQSFFRVDLEDFGATLMVVSLFVLLPIESTVLASRLFRGEIRDKTWSTLCMLPRSLADVAYWNLVRRSASLRTAPGQGCSEVVPDLMTQPYYGGGTWMESAPRFAPSSQT